MIVGVLNRRKKSGVTGTVLRFDRESVKEMVDLIGKDRPALLYLTEKVCFWMEHGDIDFDKEQVLGLAPELIVTRDENLLEKFEAFREGLPYPSIGDTPLGRSNRFTGEFIDTFLVLASWAQQS